MKKQCWGNSSCVAALHVRFSSFFSTFCSACTLYYPAVKQAGNCQPLFSRCLYYGGHCLPSVHLTSALVYRHLLVFPGLFKPLPLISRLSLSSKWLSNLPALGQTSNWISKFLPTNREHRISNFAFRHDNSQFIPCRAQIVVGLITKTDLVAPGQ